MKRPAKPSKRFGAFLQLYGPPNARNRAKLVLAHTPRPNTPEAFFEQLTEERKLDYVARASGADAVMRLKLGNNY